MKAVVFDNSGTLIRRYRALKDLKTGKICDSMNSLDVVDYRDRRALVVLQTDPSTCIVNARPHQTIYEFIERNHIRFNISYANTAVDPGEILEVLRDDPATVGDIQDTIDAVAGKNYNIQICSGSGFIVNMDRGRVDFTITAGGKLFPEVPHVIGELMDRKIDIYIASGDRKGSLMELAKLLGIPTENVFDTADTERKARIIRELRGRYSKVVMVGNGINDILALREADIGVLTLQQREPVPQRLIEAADYVIENKVELLDIEI
ncbi:MAG: HAD family hydrolase [Methanothermobacter sp.]|nr:HAD family hydrolase [Methanothermobacter sp.]